MEDARTRPGGDRAVTVADIARHAGVAVSTVSRVLNGHPHVSPDLRERVELAVRQLGYRPDPVAQGQRGARTGVVGCVVGSIANPILARQLAGVERRLRPHGYSILLAGSDEDPRLVVANLHLMARRRVDGLIVSAAAPELAGPLVPRLKIPAVMLDRDRPSARSVGAVQSDHAEGVRRAVEHLVGLGHRRIAFVGEAESVGPSRERLRGYLAGLEAAGIASDPALVLAVAPPSTGGPETAGLLAAADPPSALVAGGDRVLMGVLEALHERGVVVGADLALVGCEDTDLARLYDPALTVVARDLTAMGETAASLLLEMLQGAPGRVETLPTDLIVRRSTGPRRAARGRQPGRGAAP